MIPPGSHSSEVQSWAQVLHPSLPTSFSRASPSLFYMAHHSHPLTQNLPTPLLIIEIFSHFSFLRAFFFFFPLLNKNFFENRFYV